MVRRTTGTRGYSGYRGRRRGRKVLAVLLALILAAACGFLFAQRYIVYEADGSFRFEFPWSKPQEQTQDKNDANGETGKKDDLEITVEKPVIKDTRSGMMCSAATGRARWTRSMKRRTPSPCA